MMDKKNFFKKIRVLVVEDSAVCAEIIKHILESDSDIQVIGIARDGKEAIQKTMELRPDIITMDIHMPRMNGLEATEYIMAYQPTPIIVVSSTVKDGNTELAFQATSAGALDVLEKPDPILWESFAEVGKELINKVKFLSGVRTITHVRGKRKARLSEKQVLDSQKTVKRDFKKKTLYRPLVVAIGASTGGPQAIAKVLEPLPSDFPVPIVVGQHIAEGFLGGFISWLKSVCSLEIVEAQNMQEIVSGRVYVCPTKYNAIVVEPGIIELIKPEKSYYCPSIDLLFSSVVNVYGMHAIGVLLTGMGDDGARGLKKIFDQGGYTFAQDELTSVVYGMPKAAVKLGAAKEILPPERIGLRIKEIIEESRKLEINELLN